MAAVFLNNGAQGSVGTGRCEEAGRGQTQEKCSMVCKPDGSCTESVNVERCGCSGSATFTSGRRMFKVSMPYNIICPIHHCIPCIVVFSWAYYFLLLGWQSREGSGSRRSIGCLQWHVLPMLWMHWRLRKICKCFEIPNNSILLEQKQISNEE